MNAADGLLSRKHIRARTGEGPRQMDRLATGSESDPLAILTASKVFQHLPFDVLRKLASESRAEHFCTRTLVVSRGVVPQHLRYIIAGGLGISRTRPDGKEASLPHICAGEWASWPACFLDTPMSYDLWCLPLSTFLTFPKVSMRTAIGNNCRAAMEVSHNICRSMRSLIEWSLSASLVPEELRLAQLLFHVSDVGTDHSNTKSEASTPLTKEQIGKLGFGTRQHVAKLLGALEARGLVVQRYGKVGICSRSALSKFAFSTVW